MAGDAFGECFKEGTVVEFVDEVRAPAYRDITQRIQNIFIKKESRDSKDWAKKSYANTAADLTSFPIKKVRHNTDYLRIGTNPVTRLARYAILGATENIPGHLAVRREGSLKTAPYDGTRTIGFTELAISAYERDKQEYKRIGMLICTVDKAALLDDPDNFGSDAVSGPVRAFDLALRELETTSPLNI